MLSVLSLDVIPLELMTYNHLRFPDFVMTVSQMRTFVPAIYDSTENLESGWHHLQMYCLMDQFPHIIMLKPNSQAVFQIICLIGSGPILRNWNWGWRFHWHAICSFVR
nr:hypothetical protein Iba_chr07aCG4210 [Ipomoea batatas]